MIVQMNNLIEGWLINNHLHGGMKLNMEPHGRSFVALSLVVFMIVSAFTAFLAIIIMWKYNLSEKKAQEIKEELVRRRGELQFS